MRNTWYGHNVFKSAPKTSRWKPFLSKSLNIVTSSQVAGNHSNMFGHILHRTSTLSRNLFKNLSHTIGWVFGRIHQTQDLNLLDNLPFSLHFSDGPIVDYLNFSSAYRQLRLISSFNSSDSSLSFQNSPEHLYFLEQLPFFSSDLSSSPPQNRDQLRTHAAAIYREQTHSPTSEFNIQSFSPLSLSPDNCLPDLVVNKELAQSFEQLSIDQTHQQTSRVTSWARRVDF